MAKVVIDVEIMWYRSKNVYANLGGILKCSVHIVTALA